MAAPMQGPFGPEGQRMREQLWLLPSSDPDVPLRATLFRPAPQNGVDRFPLVVINHGTDEATRLAVSMPVYYWLSRWFVERGYAVLLPQRRGHGATGGALAEAAGDCDSPAHFQSGLHAAQDLDMAIRFIKEQPFIDGEHIISAGISTGGWASLALASLSPELLRGVVNFAGGRGGHAYGRRTAVCGEDELVAAAGAYGARAGHVPTIWFYARNDSYFGPKLARRLADAWQSQGGSVEATILPAYGSEGHNIADDRAGWDLWGAKLDQFLKGLEARHQEADLLASSDASTAAKIAAEGRDTPSTPASLVVPAAE
jgi:dienelactone hydrolase